MNDRDPVVWKKFLDFMLCDVEKLKSTDQRQTWLRCTKKQFPDYLDFCRYIEKELAEAGAKITWYSRTEAKIELISS